MKQIFSSTVWASLIVALYADIQCVNVILSSIFKADAGIMTMLYACLILMIVFISISGKRIKMLSTNITILLFALLFVFLYLLTSAFVGNPLTSFVHFGVFTISAFMIPALVQVDARILMKAMMVYPILGIFYVNDIFRIELAGHEEFISMGLSYSFLTPIIANILFLKFYFKDESKVEKIITLISTIVNGVYLQMLFQFGSRGPVLAVILALLFCFLQRNDCVNLRFHKKRTFIFFCILIIFIPIYLVVIESISEMLYSRYGISLHFLDKFVTLADQGDATNGRGSLAGVAISGILDRPLLGHGVDRFDANTGLLYPHNFMLQFLYDGGILLTLIFFIPLLLKLFKKIKSNRKESLYILILFFFVAVPGALFSGNLWSNGLLWLFFGYACVTPTRKENKLFMVR